MRRAVPFLVALLLVAGVLALPAVDPARAAALDAHELVHPPEVERGPGRVLDDRRTVAEAVLASAAAERVAEGEARLRLAEVLLTVPERPDVAADAAARRSVLRGLRAGASDLGLELAVEGEREPAERGVSFRFALAEERLVLEVQVPGEPPLRVADERFAPPGRASLLPPIVAIALAIAFRRPILALFFGVLVGSVLVELPSAGPVASAARGLAEVFTVYFLSELVDPERGMIIGFVVAMLAMVGVLTRAGGIRGLMDAIARFAGSVRSTQVATYLMGLVVFFDDYANTILVGSTMRPLTDRFRIAREKLAYIVDSTAAPVAGLSIFSTWIAFEVSTFSAQLPAAGLSTGDGYAVFVQTIPYRFYCVFTLAFVAMVVVSGRDLGPMLAAERRARRTGRVVREGGTPLVSEAATALEAAPGVRARAWRGALPVLVFLGVTLFEILRAGGGLAMRPAELFTIEGMTAVLYDGSGSRPLLVGSLAGLVVAALAAAHAGIAREVPAAAWRTLRSMGVALAILYLAWMIGAVCSDLGTASYLTALVGDSLEPLLLPAILFLLSGFVAFSTGSSWSTMGILLPIVVPLAYGMGADLEVGRLAGSAAASGHLLMVMSIGAVLEGAIFGDHCSPISDTTVMSSIASASDHIDHVKTQAPYACLTMAVALGAGYLPCALLGASPFAGWAIGLAALAGVLLWRGRSAENAAGVPERSVRAA